MLWFYAKVKLQPNYHYNCVFSFSVIKVFWLYIMYNVVWLTCSLNQINNACKWGALCPGSFTERTRLFCLVHMVRWMGPSCKVHFPAVMLTGQYYHRFSSYAGITYAILVSQKCPIVCEQVEVIFRPLSSSYALTGQYYHRFSSYAGITYAILVSQKCPIVCEQVEVIFRSK